MRTLTIVLLAHTLTLFAGAASASRSVSTCGRSSVA